MKAITETVSVLPHVPSVPTPAGNLTMSTLRERVRRPMRFLDEQAACRTSGIDVAANDWTPEYEDDRVPPRLRAICDGCPVWQDCLSEALRMNDIGYRASMTTKQRRRAFGDLLGASRPMTRKVSVPTRSTRTVSDQDRTPTHATGAGSLNCYRRGCRCDECRGHNAAARSRERARAS